MIRLSDRLQIIADRSKDHKTMADIGTDHGFLPVYMVESGRCEFAVAADISGPSLDKAAALCRERGIERVDVRRGDGISVLAPGEVGCVVIAGMGGLLMIEILEKDPELTDSFGRFVLQPRTAAGELRRWLVSHGFAITGEDVVREGRYIPQIITAVPRAKLRPEEKDLAEGADFGSAEVSAEVPPWIRSASGPVAEHIGRILRREEAVLEGLGRAADPDEERAEQTRRNIAYLKGLLTEGGKENG